MQPGWSSGPSTTDPELQLSVAGLAALTSVAAGRVVRVTVDKENSTVTSKFNLLVAGG